jgi:hypothetical protein
LDQVDRAGDVGLNHVPYFIEVLVEETVAEAAAGVGEEGVDRAPAGGVDMKWRAKKGCGR